MVEAGRHVPRVEGSALGLCEYSGDVEVNPKVISVSPQTVGKHGGRELTVQGAYFPLHYVAGET